MFCKSAIENMATMQIFEIRLHELNECGILFVLSQPVISENKIK
jgi:hypothetical protein